MIRPARTNIELCNIPVSFSNLWDDSAWGLWLWKLDPYRSVFQSSHAKINIECGHMQCSMEKLEKMTLVWKEENSFIKQHVYVHPDEETLWVLLSSAENETRLQYCVDRKWDKITLLQDTTCSAGQIAFEYLSLIMPVAMLKHGVLTFHGVLMEHEGRGIIISAPSGTGKTTHARMWRDIKNALIINGDRATCRKMDGVWTGFGLPWSGTSGEQINRSVPLTALVVLERGEQNEAHRITGLEAFGAVWPHVQYPCWDEKLVGTALDLTNDFLNHIPIIRLQCRPDAEAVDVLAQALEDL